MALTTVQAVSPRRRRGSVWATLSIASLVATGLTVLPSLPAAADPAPDAVYSSDFNGIPTGTFWHSTDGWNVKATSPNTVSATETPSTSDKSIQLTRTATDSTGTVLGRRFGTPLSGVITIKARVMRPEGTPSGFFGLPYVYNEAGNPAVSVALTQGTIRAYRGTTLDTLATYAAGTWYDLTLTIDTNAQRFDLDVNGAKLVDDGTFRAPMTGISRIEWYANGGERGTAQVDNVSITRSAQVEGATYYVSAAGDDANAGTSETGAWRTLDKVNATTFKPGDRVLLRSGDTWTGQLWPKGSGTAGHPIVIDAYGSGAKPSIQGNGTVGDAVRLNNQEYWEIRDLDVSNMIPAGVTPGANLGDFRGIGVHGDNGQILDDILIDSVDVHDVTGELNWIGGSSSDNSPGVNWGTGWDRSKNTGGIVFGTGVANPTSPGDPTTFSGITVQNSKIRNTSFAGITIKQYTGSTSGTTSTGWGTRRTANDPLFAPHTDVILRNNYLTQSGTAFGADGIYMTDTRDGLVEGNVLDHVGVSGIETYAADRVTVQYNEIFGTTQKQGSADGNGMDPDIATTNQLFQYNYLHDNVDGILLCGCGSAAFGSAVIRYNVVVGSTRWNLHMSQVGGTVAHVYNNTFYSTTASNMVTGSVGGTVTLTNNIFASRRPNPTLLNNSNVAYVNNAYAYGVQPLAKDTSAVVVADPLFVDPNVAGPYGSDSTPAQLTTAKGFSLQPGSLLIDGAKDITDRGPRDFIGTPLVAGARADLGAFEYHTPTGQTTETVSGLVRNQNGEAVPGAAVVVGSGAQSVTATADAIGYYSASGVPFGDKPVTVSAVNHDPFTGTVTVSAGSSTRYDIQLTNNQTTGSVTGRVLTEKATPVAGATVTVSKNGATITTGQSGSDGQFTVTDVGLGTGYTVTASTANLPGIPVQNVTVGTQPATLGALYIDSPSDEYAINESFDQLPPGTLQDGTNGLHVVAVGGNAVDVTEAPSAADHSARLTRTVTENGAEGTSLGANFDQPLHGLVTIRADIMRASGSGFFGIPYIRTTDNKSVVSVGTQNGNFTAYDGSTSKTVGTYTLGRWYAVTLVVDTENQRYSLSIDGQQVLTDAKFRNTMDGVAKVAWYANAGETGVVNVNNLRISRGADPVTPTAQSISFDALATRTFGDADFAVSASASSGLPVTFAASGVCTVSGATVHLTGPGQCSITASQPGNGTVAAATDVTQSFTVAPAGPVVIVPSAPTGLTTGLGDAAVKVTWVAPTSNGGAPISGYTVTAAPGGKTCTTTGALFCTVTGLTNGKSYSFTVTATNSAGTSAPSAATAPVTPTFPPGTAGNVSVAVSAKAQCINSKPSLAVYVLNKESIPVNLVITTPFGNRTVTGLAAGAATYQTLTPTDVSVAAGIANIAATKTINGNSVNTTYEAGYLPVSCG